MHGSEIDGIVLRLAVAVLTAVAAIVALVYGLGCAALAVAPEELSLPPPLLLGVLLSCLGTLLWRAARGAWRRCGPKSRAAVKVEDRLIGDVFLALVVLSGLVVGAVGWIWQALRSLPRRAARSASQFDSYGDE